MPQTPGTDPGTGISGFGVRLSGASAGAIGMIRKVTFPGLESDPLDITTTNAPGRWRQFIAGLKAAKEITLELVYDATNKNTLQAILGAANQVWTVTFPDTTTFVCSGHIRMIGEQLPHDNVITANVTIQLSGAPTYTVPSGVV